MNNKSKLFENFSKCKIKSYLSFNSGIVYHMAERSFSMSLGSLELICECSCVCCLFYKWGIYTKPKL